MRSLVVSIMIIVVGIISKSESSPISAQIAYQGILTDNTGNPLADGPHSLEFTLYTDSTGGTAIWTESKVISTKNGIFSHMLGLVI